MLRVTILEGKASPRSLQLARQQVHIGRDPGNDVVLRDGYVSARHGEIRVDGALVTYEDLVTTNGSVLRRQGRLLPVDARNFSQVVLADGDELLLGDGNNPVVVRVEIGPAPQDVGAGRATSEVDAVGSETMLRIRAGFDREALLALHQLVSRLAACLELDGVLAAAAGCLLDAFRRATHVSVHLLDDETGEYRPALARSRQGDAVALPLSRTIRDKVLARGMAVTFSDMEDAIERSESLHAWSVSAGVCAPLWDGRRITGLVQVDCRGTAGASFDKRDLEILVLFAHQVAMTVENARLHERLRHACEQSIRGLVRALEAKDEYTSGHSEAVAALCVDLALGLGLTAVEAETVRRAALLHDIGKIGIPHDVLNKTERLTPEEFRILKTHPDIGARILQPFGFLSDLLPIVLHHHERWDGRGYPTGLAGDAIPVGARILAVADTFDALVSNRSYRAGIAAAAALQEIRRSPGQFDPEIVDVLARVIDTRTQRCLLAERERVSADEPELAPAGC